MLSERSMSRTLPLDVVRPAPCVSYLEHSATLAEIEPVFEICTPDWSAPLHIPYLCGMTISSLGGLDLSSRQVWRDVFPSWNTIVARNLWSHVAASTLRGSRPGLRQWSMYLATCSDTR
jgi:hypothetical protein